MSKNTVEVELECGCKPIFYPRPYIGDTVYCRLHVQYKKVVVGLPAQVDKVKITCRDCHFNKSYEEETARIVADTHALKCDHEVIITAPDGSVIDVIKL